MTPAQAKSARERPSPAPLGRPAGVRRLVPPLLAAGLVAVLGGLLLRPAPGHAGGDTLIGKSAPDFGGRALDGQSVQLSQLRGQPVVLNFWASWCGPCQTEAPLLSELSGRQQAGGFRMVGLLFQETSEANARKFVARHALNYPNILTRGVETGISYGVSGIPVTVFIDKSGRVQGVDRGGLNRERLNAGLQKIGLPSL